MYYIFVLEFLERIIYGYNFIRYLLLLSFLLMLYCIFLI